MCGIAGYSVSAGSKVERTLAAQALLAGIAERGADAAGYAHRSPGGPLEVLKQRRGASVLLERLRIPGDATEVLLHVRDYTKGHPTIDANNHPVRHGAVAGVHNGHIYNDDELMAAHGFERAEPAMTVDSEAIFALAERFENEPEALEQLRGSLAAAWLDDRRDGTLYCARGSGRPLWIGEGDEATFFASTRKALEVVEQYTPVSLEKEELPEGTLLAVAEGRVVASERFTPNRAYSERPRPPVRAPHEGRSCLELLAALAAAA
jgi:glucosamine--fructose-6-phosphate aminotransferase (isomerizing)